MEPWSAADESSTFERSRIAAPSATEARASGLAWCVRLFLVAAAFVTFGVGAWVIAITALPLVWLCGGPLPARQKRCQRVVAACFRLFQRVLRALDLVAFDVSGALLNTKWQRHRQVIAVANHPSLLENIAAIAVAGPVCCVVAPWLSRNPLLAPLLDLCGHVRTKDDSLQGRALAMEAAIERLEQGHSLLIFPEGTRSPPQGLGRFQRGAFELATRRGLPLLPIAVGMTPDVLTSGSRWYDLPARVVQLRLDPLDVWEPVDYPHAGRDAKWLARAVREQLARALELPHE